MTLTKDDPRRSRGRCKYLYEDFRRCLWEGPLLDHLCTAHIVEMAQSKIERLKFQAREREMIDMDPEWEDR